METVLQGECILPGDKSISHRALLLLGLSQGSGTIRNLSSGQDVMSTMRCLQALGCAIEHTGENQYKVNGSFVWQSPSAPLDCGNSGTTIRLLASVLAGAGVSAQLTGDESLLKRPMGRIITPLSQMGSVITAQGSNQCAPLYVSPSPQGLHGIHYTLPMPSAQVKSAVLLAGLFTPRTESLSVTEPVVSRDHTERMLTALGATVKRDGKTIQLVGRQDDLIAQDILVPGDISSAAFWLVGAAILPGSHITIRQVGLNPTRSGVLDVLTMAGAELDITDRQETMGEPYGDISLTGGRLTGDISITGSLVPEVIDEIPVLTVLGLFTHGRFTLRQAEELRFKESDRLAAMIEILQRLGVAVTVYEDGFSFEGNPDFILPPIDTPFQTYHDHRLVMALEILNLRAKTPLPIEGRTWASVSYPTFFETLDRLKAGSV